VDFIDEQDVTIFQRGQLPGKIAGLGNHRAGRRAEVDPQFPRHDLRQRRLAEARRANEQHMVQRIAARFRSLDEHLHVRPRRRLPDEFGQCLRPDRGIDIVLALVSGKKSGAGRFAHGRLLTPALSRQEVISVHVASSFRPRRINAAASAPSPSAFSAAATAAEACGAP